MLTRFTIIVACALIGPTALVSLAYADCTQLSTGVIDCDGATGYPLGNSDHVYVPRAGFETYQPPTYQQFAPPKYLDPESFDNPQQ